DLTDVRGLVVGFSASAIREPLTIDFEHTTHRRPVARVVARRVPVAPTLDGVVTNDEWATGDPASLTPVTVGSAPAATTVRVVYDHENLYVAFECHEPRQDQMKLQAVGRDGNVWALDHIE